MGAREEGGAVSRGGAQSASRRGAARRGAALRSVALSAVSGARPCAVRAARTAGEGALAAAAAAGGASLRLPAGRSCSNAAPSAGARCRLASSFSSTRTPQLLLRRAALEDIFPRSASVPGIAPTQTRHPALGLHEPHCAHTGPRLQPVQVPLGERNRLLSLPPAGSGSRRARQARPSVKTEAKHSLSTSAFPTPEEASSPLPSIRGGTLSLGPSPPAYVPVRRTPSGCLSHPAPRSAPSVPWLSRSYLYARGQQPCVPPRLHNPASAPGTFPSVPSASAAGPCSAMPPARLLCSASSAGGRRALVLAEGSHRVARVGRDLKDREAPTPPPQAEAASLHISYQPRLPGAPSNLALTTSRGGRGTHSLPGHLFQHLSTLTVKNFPDIQLQSSLLRLQTVSSCPPAATHPRKELPPLLLVGSPSVLEGCNEVTPQPSLLQAVQAQLPRPAFVGEVLQPSAHLRGPPLPLKSCQLCAAPMPLRTVSPGIPPSSSSSRQNFALLKFRVLALLFARPASLRIANSSEARSLQPRPPPILTSLTLSSSLASTRPREASPRVGPSVTWTI